MNAKLAGLLISAVTAFHPLSAHAQSIEVGALGEAQNYDGGALDFASGGLDPALWQGTSAMTATALITAAPIGSDNPIIRDMVRTVILSAGVPPEGSATTSKAYERARLKAVMALGDPDALDDVARRSPELTRDPAVRADLALASGDISGACTMADSVTEGRGTPVWARLRAFCHVTRDEVAAAELTTKLLRNSGYDDPTYFALMNRLTGASDKAVSLDGVTEPIALAMASRLDGVMTPISAVSVAKNPKADRDDRLAAIFMAGERLSDGDITAIMNGLIYDGVPVEALDTASSFDASTAKIDRSALGFAQSFALTQRGNNAPAMVDLLLRAEEKGGLARFARILKSEISALQASDKVAADLSLFTRVAVISDDIGALQSLFAALDGDPRQNRIALAADALGNGFRLGTLGEGIEGGLAMDGAAQARAMRDALLALALGSTLSETGKARLAGGTAGKGRSLTPGDLAVLRAASTASSRAETTLRAAALLDGARLDAPSLAAIVSALAEAQLNDFAGQVAAQDFIATLDR